MEEISAQLVKQLRERTGAGMMECKKRSGRSQGRPGRSRSRAAQARHRVGRQEGHAHHQAGRDRHLHSSGRAAGRAGRSELRVRFRGAHRRFSGTGAGPGHADRRGRSAVHPQGRRHRRPRSTKRKTFSARARSTKASPRRWSTRSSKAAWPSTTKKSASTSSPSSRKTPLTIDRADQDQDRQAGREHLGLALRPLQSRRYGRPDTPGAGTARSRVRRGHATSAFF